MNSKTIRQRGLFMAEMLTGTALLGVIIVGLAVVLNGFAKSNHYQWSRQRCTAAAMAQLDSITATAAPVDPQELQRLWPTVSVTVERAPAGAPWDGLELVHVTATMQQATVRLARYIMPPAPTSVAQGGRQ
jgi:hypothetical protein